MRGAERRHAGMAGHAARAAAAGDVAGRAGRHCSPAPATWSSTSSAWFTTCGAWNRRGDGGADPFLRAEPPYQRNHANAHGADGGVPAAELHRRLLRHELRIPAADPLGPGCWWTMCGHGAGRARLGVVFWRKRYLARTAVSDHGNRQDWHASTRAVPQHQAPDPALPPRRNRRGRDPAERAGHAPARTGGDGQAQRRRPRGRGDRALLRQHRLSSGSMWCCSPSGSATTSCRGSSPSTPIPSPS